MGHVMIKGGKGWWWCGTFGGVLFIIMMGMILSLCRICGYVYLQRHNSFAMSVYLNYVCGIVQVYLAIRLSFQYVLFPVSGGLC
jgi:hypothetical protein